MRRLLIRPGAIGDVIVSLPALEWLRANYTEVWVPAAVAPLIQFADRVRAISATGLDLLELGLAPSSLLEELGSFDSIVSWYGATRESFRGAVDGLPFEFCNALPPVTSGTHAVDFYLEQVGAPVGAVPRIRVPRRSPEFFAIHPFSGNPEKNWPLDRFRELAARLPAEWCEGPVERAHRFANLGDLARWIAGAITYIGNDSGISHLAAAVGAPVVALFGPTNPRIWAPRGPRVTILPLTTTVNAVIEATV